VSRIKGKTVLITGGASGIGYLVGRQLLREEAKSLILWDIQEEALNRVVREFSDQGYRVSGFPVDVADLGQVQRVVRDMETQGLAVDLLINNAGIVVGKEFSGHSHEEIERTMRINSSAPMHLTRELLPGMLERGQGHIVNIASAAGLVSNPRMSIYCASKWAVIGWSDSLRLELEQAGSAVKVTTVLPYYIDTGMFAGVRSPVIPILQPDYVATQIVEAIKKDRIFLRLPRLLNAVPLLRGLLPVRWFDKIGGEWMGVYHSMRTFRGRS
jgi:all-trans-retinol dehydrogenase (NAD+)